MSDATSTDPQVETHEAEGDPPEGLGKALEAGKGLAFEEAKDQLTELLAELAPKCETAAGNEALYADLHTLGFRLQGVLTRVSRDLRDVLVEVVKRTEENAILRQHVFEMTTSGYRLSHALQEVTKSAVSEWRSDGTPVMQSLELNADGLKHIMMATEGWQSMKVRQGENYKRVGMEGPRP